MEGIIGSNPISTVDFSSFSFEVVQYNDMMRLWTHCVHVAKCLPDPNYKQNPDKRVLNEVLRVKGQHVTHSDACTKRQESQ